jgi:hypothetical protein
MNNAWLLDRRGNEIFVENHPSDKINDEVAEFVQEFGNRTAKELAGNYLQTGDEKLFKDIVTYYNENWCKVRVWGTFSTEVTFRITSTGFNWYSTIIDFLYRHKELHRCLVTVESDKPLRNVVYWENIPVSDILDGGNEHILASALTQ